jgi:outer membrane receptor protein involved in Fe transport
MGLKFKSLLLSIIIFIFAFVMNVAAQEKTPDSARRLPYGKTGWSTFIRGGYLHQFKTDIDNSSEFSVNRFFVQGGVSYSPEIRRSVSLAVGYGYDSYDFSGSGGFGALDPWSEINSLRISAPVRWGFDDKWTLFAIPTVRTTVQNGADLNDGIQGGGFAGFSYRFSDRLTLGPGIGAVTQIEDSTSVFPVLLIDWEIIDNLSLRTGGGTGATLGPGLELAWRASDNWSFSLGGRYERLRFRLDDKNISPGGVGEDRAFPIFAGINYTRGRRLGLSLVGGVEVGGELIIEDGDGSEIISEYHDPAPFLGFAFRLRF